MARFCEQCGAPLTEGDRFCDKCGHAATGGGTLPASVPPPSSARGPRSNFSLFLIIGLIVALVVGGGIALWQLWPKGISTTVQTPASSASSPTPSFPPPTSTTPSPTPSPNAEGLLYAADFSQPEKEMALGWPNTTEPGKVFQDGRYVISRDTAGIWFCGPDQLYTDYVLEVRAQPVEGGANCMFSVQLSYQNNDNYYDLGFTQGYWRFEKWVAGQPTVLAGWSRNHAIPIGMEPSQIVVSCHGSHFILSINGAWLGEVTDDTYTTGAIGVGAGSVEDGHTTVAFDNLRLWQIGQGPALPQPPQVQGSGLLFAADFSSTQQGWKETTYSGLTFRREDSAYLMRVDTPTSVAEEQIGSSFRDFTVELEAQATAGQPSFSYGLYFRQTGQGNTLNAYEFVVDNDGYYRLDKVVNHTWTSLIDWTSSPAVLTSGGANRLRVTCQGDRIMLAINGHDLGEVQDNTFAQGDIAMRLGCWGQAGVEASFRSLQVWSVDAAPAMTVEPLQPQLIFSEDFSQPKIEWFEGYANDNPDYYLHLEEGGYFLTIGGRGTWIVNRIGGEFPADCTAELQASILVGDPNDIFALLVRYQDENNYLGLMVNSAGTYDFLRCVDGELTNLVGPAYSSELRMGTASNRLKVVCQGDRFRFFVNDQFLGEVTDNTFPQGQVTFAARRLGTDFLHVRYESIKIWAMPE